MKYKINNIIYEYTYFEYNVKVHLFPQDDEVILKICSDMAHINEKGKYNLAYGVFALKTMQERKAFFRGVVVSIGYLQGVPSLFSYQIKLDNANFENIKVLHQGLILSSQNPGRDIHVPTLIGTCIYQHVFGNVYVTNLVADPLFIGMFSRNYEGVFPSPYNDNRFPIDKKYYEAATVCYESYVLKHFDAPEKLKFDLKRFVIGTKSKDLGFETDMRKMKRDSDVLVNLFSMFWLNYEEQEIMMQIGTVNSDITQKTINQYNLQHIFKDTVDLNYE